MASKLSGIEGSCRPVGCRRARPVCVEDDVCSVGQPPAGVGKRHVEVSHDEVYRASPGVAHEAAEGVARGAEAQARVVVVVKRAQALVAHHTQPEPFGHRLYG